MVTSGGKLSTWDVIYEKDEWLLDGSGHGPRGKGRGRHSRRRVSAVVRAPPEGALASSVADSLGPGSTVSGPENTWGCRLEPSFQPIELFIGHLYEPLHKQVYLVGGGLPMAWLHAFVVPSLRYLRAGDWGLGRGCASPCLAAPAPDGCLTQGEPTLVGASFELQQPCEMGLHDQPRMEVTPGPPPSNRCSKGLTWEA